LGIVVVQPQDFDEKIKKKKEFAVSVCFFALCRVNALSSMSPGHIATPRVMHSIVLYVLILSLRSTHHCPQHHPPHPLRRRHTGVKKQP
jgi:hypothetical protein